MPPLFLHLSLHLVVCLWSVLLLMSYSQNRYTVMPALVAFLDQLTKWYVRLNRERLKGADEDAAQGLSVLFWVLQQVSDRESDRESDRV